ncbi:hypothetical protein SAMN06265339_0671 [Desulfurobacterium pacificum]|uniref:Uncharacterized protein n=1 Tax=Desulfurobacterium pacificum TaxID=240166 RepID=A0ABY1NGA1_9BACT|nr:hypothetical protein [Desulfurobacterium pacificum]SMP08921.1 hypothetical protein SAMN06265339_0671 [Desulfurobacterium pacificum]
MTAQEFAKLFIENYKRALLTKSKEIPVLQDERVRKEITDLALQVLNEMAGTLDLSNLKAQELQSLIEPVIWKVAKALEENLKEEIRKEMLDQHMEMGGALSKVIGKAQREIVESVSSKIEDAEKNISKTISDIAYQSERIW